MTNLRDLARILACLVALSLRATPVEAEESPALGPPGSFGLASRYRIAEGSTITADCTPCAEPPVTLPISGSFRVSSAGDCATCPRLVITDFAFTTSKEAYRGKGRGSYRLIGAATAGEVDAADFGFQQMRLAVNVIVGREFVRV
jgi:hypothetical protein